LSASFVDAACRRGERCLEAELREPLPGPRSGDRDVGPARGHRCDEDLEVDILALQPFFERGHGAIKAGGGGIHPVALLGKARHDAVIHEGAVLVQQQAVARLTDPECRHRADVHEIQKARGIRPEHFELAERGTIEEPGARSDGRRFALRGLELDPIDPFVNFTMGRTFWLEGDLESSLAWLERATSISPNYAQGIYARAWSETLAGRGLDGRKHVDLAMRLSPLDPLYYAMLATRAFTHMILGEDAEAASWAERAARSPGAHVLIALIAVAAHALGGDEIRAASWAANVRSRNPRLSRSDFFRAFPMKCEATKLRVSDALARVGF